jgi:glycosyltransferase involved in cell wall biosynthesis
MAGEQRKLLILFPSTARGGCEEYALTIAAAAKEHGWEIHAAFPRTQNTQSLIRDFESIGRYHPLDIAESEGTGWTQKINLLRRFILTLALFWRLRPNRVQINVPWPTEVFPSIVACGVFKIPAVVVFHLVPFPMSNGGWRCKLANWVRTRNQQWVAVSLNNRVLLAQIYRMDPKDIQSIYNGVALPANECQGPSRTVLREEVRKELGLPDDSTILISVGRLDPQKGYRDIIPAIPHLVKESPNVRFVWVGAGDQRAELVQEIQRYQVENYVHLLGYRSDVPRLLKASDVFLFPTRFEGHPFTLLEAMSFRVPVVASNVSSIPEVITNNTHGLLFRAGDSCDLLETLRCALRRPDLMRRMAENAFSRLQEFSRDKMIGKMIDLLTYAEGSP